MKVRITKIDSIGSYATYIGAAYVLLRSGDCYAYIDPNTAGWLFQLLFPVLVAVGGMWAIFRQRICALWNRLIQRSDKHT